MAFSMLAKRFWPYYGAIGFGLLVLKSGTYVQNYRDNQLTDFKNKSKLFGDRCLSHGGKGW